MVSKCKQKAAQCARSCLSVRTHPLTATGTLSQKSLCHACQCTKPTAGSPQSRHQAAPSSSTVATKITQVPSPPFPTSSPIMGQREKNGGQTECSNPTEACHPHIGTSHKHYHTNSPEVKQQAVANRQRKLQTVLSLPFPKSSPILGQRKKKNGVQTESLNPTASGRQHEVTSHKEHHTNSPGVE